MTVRLQRHGDMFLSRCALAERPGYELVALVDSGAADTFISTNTCQLAGLQHMSSSGNVGCIHGDEHMMVEVARYRGTLILDGHATHKAFFAMPDPVIGGMYLDAVLGRDVLCHFDVRLNWRDGFGTMGR